MSLFVLKWRNICNNLTFFKRIFRFLSEKRRFETRFSAGRFERDKKLKNPAAIPKNA